MVISKIRKKYFLEMQIKRQLTICFTILKDCGIIIETVNIKLLAEKIKFVFDNTGIVRDLGIREDRDVLRNIVLCLYETNYLGYLTDVI